MIHIRYSGRSYDYTFRQVGVSARMRDYEIKRALSVYLDLAIDSFDAYVVDRTAKGDLVVRPEAVYG